MNELYDENKIQKPYKICCTACALYDQPTIDLFDHVIYKP